MWWIGRREVNWEVLVYGELVVKIGLDGRRIFLLEELPCSGAGFGDQVGGVFCWCRKNEGLEHGGKPGFKRPFGLGGWSGGVGHDSGLYHLS